MSQFGLLGYSAAKEALVNLMRNYASILAEHRVRVNVVQPTGVNTPMIERWVEDRGGLGTEQDRLALVNAMPVFAVEPVDISNAMLWLCSDEARYVTGSAPSGWTRGQPALTSPLGDLLTFSRRGPVPAP